MATLESVNVGLPAHVEWHGRRVRTAIWKHSVYGRVIVRRYNLEGDRQADLAGHGGEHRAVLVYQLESYRYWRTRLARDDLLPGIFGENFTTEGLPDDATCIGDRYRIGTALFEVTQPRVTCYRVGLRLGEPRMASLLVESGRPGFYMRVLEEGEVGAGDAIEKVADGPGGVTVAGVDALLYLPNPAEPDLARAAGVPALSWGWRRSVERLRANDRAAADTYRPVRIVDSVRETADVRSLLLSPVDGDAPTAAEPGQSIALHFSAKGVALLRHYSLSAPVDGDRYRISVKRGEGKGSRHLHDNARVGDMLDVGEPQGSFTLTDRGAALALISAGIGVTPLLAVLHRLADTHDQRPVWWLYGARDGQSHSFAAEASALLARLTSVHVHICYSNPLPADMRGRDYDEAGRLNAGLLDALGVPGDADLYLCGPPAFVDAFTESLDGRAFAVHVESFGAGAGEPMAIDRDRPPHAPEGPAGAGPLVTFARSGLKVPWDVRYGTLLELAEACNVPTAWSCRTGVCQTCATTRIEGEVTYDPRPLNGVEGGRVLICCARPQTSLCLDL